MATNRSVLHLRQVAARAAGKILEAKSLIRIEQQYQVWKLRKDGHSLHDIAATLGISIESVRRCLTDYAKHLIAEMSETVEESRKLQEERLDGMLKAYQPLAEAGNLSAASAVLAIEARRSKLLALDVPETKKLDVTGIREYVGVNLDDV